MSRSKNAWAPVPLLPLGDTGPSSGPLFGSAPSELVVLDVETTGLDVAAARVVELAGVVLALPSGEMLERRVTLVHPGGRIPPEVSAIHGIRDRDVARAPRFGEAWWQFERWAGGRPLVAHNGYRYDFPVLRAEFARTVGGVCWARVPVYDSLRVARRLLRKDSDVSGHGLGVLAAWAGVDTPPHRALGDCEALCRVLVEMLRRLGGGASFEEIHGKPEVL